MAVILGLVFLHVLFIGTEGGYSNLDDLLDKEFQESPPEAQGGIVTWATHKDHGNWTQGSALRGADSPPQDGKRHYHQPWNEYYHNVRLNHTEYGEDREWDVDFSVNDLQEMTRKKALDLRPPAGTQKYLLLLCWGCVFGYCFLNIYGVAYPHTRCGRHLERFFRGSSAWPFT
eukprot:gnl/TRDRNA2_/TRDRNA2_44165_c0_seq1.p1 gnl/TRDRNA2_/TRDRNA2_44165_c0~~gnl/TRDRNA2_/TRDRNA2_44165_c0_seq1.p1  ORF type:complete len:187 (-),score=22.25 gnl/TRDRNA2_/TRDRNA2_44165_c0_seq1:239-757(-)